MIITIHTFKKYLKIIMNHIQKEFNFRNQLKFNKKFQYNFRNDTSYNKI